jgi:hypothetical protein
MIALTVGSRPPTNPVIYSSVNIMLCGLVSFGGFEVLRHHSPFNPAANATSEAAIFQDH